MPARPTVAEERWGEARDRFGAFLVPEGGAGSWRASSLFARIAFFFLGSICVFALCGFLSLMGDWHIGTRISGVAAIVLAELLIRRLHFFWSGIEEALYVCGVGLLLASFHSNDASIPLVIGVSALVLGLRLLNPLLTTISFCALTWALKDASGAPVAAIVAWVLAFLAWGLTVKYFSRPSHERIVAWLCLVMPAAGWFWAHDHDVETWSWHEGSSSAVDVMGPIGILLAGAVVTFFLAHKYRLHIHALAFLECCALMAFDLRHLTGASIEQRFIVEGSLVLIASVLIERRLRDRTDGVTSRQLRTEGAGWKLVELAASAAAAGAGQTPAERTQDPQVSGGGGKFGGGGATESF